LTKPATRHLTIVAALLAMIGPFSIDAYLPSFPTIEMEFGVNRAVLSHSLGVYLLAFGISTLFWGPLADRYGRRFVIILSMALYTLGSIACALAGSAESFIFLRILQGLAASGGLIAGRAMIRDAHDAESAHKAMSQVMLLFALSPAIAPVLGGWLHDQFGWRSIFWFLSIYGISMVLMGFFVSETLDSEQRRSIHPATVIRVYISAILHKRLPALILCLSLSFAGVFLYIAGAPSDVQLPGSWQRRFWLVIYSDSGRFNAGCRHLGSTGPPMAIATYHFRRLDVDDPRIRRQYHCGQFGRGDYPDGRWAPCALRRRSVCDDARNHRAGTGLPAHTPWYCGINAGIFANDDQCRCRQSCSAVPQCQLAKFRLWPVGIPVFCSRTLVPAWENKELRRSQLKSSGAL